MRVSPAELAKLRPKLESLLGSIESLRPLPAGAGGQSYRVASARGLFVAKVFLPDAPVLLGPVEQYTLLAKLAAKGIAPRPIACDPLLGLLVTEFEDGLEVATPESLSRDEGIAALAGLLRRLHSVAHEVPPFAPLDYASSYLQRLGGRETLQSGDAARFDEFLDLASKPIGGPPCLCHNDLTADNLLLGSAPKLIDFDYAVLATPVLDLASVVFMNALPADRASLLLDAYHAGPAPYSVEEFARVQRLLALIAHFWSLAAGEGAPPVVARYRIRDD